MALFFALLLSSITPAHAQPSAQEVLAAKKAFCSRACGDVRCSRNFSNGRGECFRICVAEASTHFSDDPEDNPVTFGFSCVR